MLKNLSRIRVSERGVINGFRTGVSLHCHTQHSKEVLDFIPYYAERIPVVAKHFKKETDAYLARNGVEMDFTSAYWTPPVSARQVYDAEREQIERTLNAKAIVSITDHDTIEAGTLLHTLDRYNKIPISTEWTVPYGEAYVHMGVHNLPPENSVEMMNVLKEYTARPSRGRLIEILAMLNAIPSVLLVLNHPIWDIEHIGQERHMILVRNFIAEHGRWIHALEINGFRPAPENRDTVRMAEDLGFPLVSGGDRHGCAPNTSLNLTNVSSFDEFAAEVRCDKRSEVLLMPQYQENVYLRMIVAAGEVLRHYPQHPYGRQHWIERVFVLHQGVERPLAYFWESGGPVWAKLPVWVLRVLSSPRFRPAMRLMMARGEEVTP